MSEENILQPVSIVYCGKCGMPPEYCEYGPDFESHCDPWLKKNHPELRSKLSVLRKHEAKGGEAAAEAEAPESNRPTAPWTTEERLTAFYEKYQPDKLSDVPSLLEKYAGKEDKLFMALVKKYGDEPDDPYYSDSEDEEDELAEGVEKINVSGRKRRGAKAKTAEAIETKVIIQKVARTKRKTTTVVVGMDTVPGIKLKDASKALSKRFAGSSSVKDGSKGKEIILQGDHMEEVAAFVVDKFKVPGESVFLDMDGEFISFA